MWENEIVVLVTSLKKRILANQNKAKYGRIAADNAVPPFIKSLFENQVERFLEEEQPITVKSTPHFSLNEQDLAHLTGRFTDAFRDSALFSVEEVEETLRTALVLRMDYLVKPIDTMRRLLFNGEQVANQKKIETRLFPFRKVLPYADELVKECHRLNYKEIEADEYGKLVDDMLQRLVEPEPVKLTLHDFSVLTEFLSETKGEEVHIVEGPLVQEFLADRSLWGFRRAVEVEMKLGKEDFNRVDLEMTLKRYLELKADFSKTQAALPDVPAADGEPEAETMTAELADFELTETEPEAAEEPSSEEDVETVESGEILDSNGNEVLDFDDIVAEPELSVDEEEPVDADEALYLDDGVEEAAEPEPQAETEAVAEEESWDLEDVLGEPEETARAAEPAAEREPEEAPEEPVQAPTLKEERPAKKQMRIIRREQKQEAEDELDVARPAPTLGLKKLIDKKTEKVFVKKLFGNDQDAYGQLIEKLEESESWRVAKILIDNELFKRDVDPFSREAIKLVDLVYSRYYPEEGVGGV